MRDLSDQYDWGAKALKKRGEKKLMVVALRVGGSYVVAQKVLQPFCPTERIGFDGQEKQLDSSTNSQIAAVHLADHITSTIY